MARTDAEKVQYVIDLLRQGAQNGRLSQAELDQHLRELGVEPEQATTVTVTAQVRGDLEQLRQRNGQVVQAVEAELAALAGRVGLTVVAGSVQVTVENREATRAPAAPVAPARQDPWRPQAAEQRGRTVSISVGWNGQIPAQAREIVEQRLARLGGQVGLNLVPGSVAITNLGAGTVRIEGQATGSVEQLVEHGVDAGQAIEQALTELATQYGLPRPQAGSVRVQV